MTFDFLDRRWSTITTATMTENHILWSRRWHSAEFWVGRPYPWQGRRKILEVRKPQMGWDPKYEYNLCRNPLTDLQLCTWVGIQTPGIKTNTNQRGIYPWKPELPSMLLLWQHMAQSIYTSGGGKLKPYWPEVAEDRTQDWQSRERKFKNLCVNFPQILGWPTQAQVHVWEMERT